MFWEEAKQVRKGEESEGRDVMEVNGKILRNGVAVRRRWAKYFEQVLNVEDVRETKYKCSWR